MNSAVLRFTLMVSLFVCVVSTRSISAASLDAETKVRVEIMRRTMRNIKERRAAGYKSTFADDIYDIARRELVRLGVTDDATDEEEEAERRKRADHVTSGEENTPANIGEPINSIGENSKVNYIKENVIRIGKVVKGGKSIE